MCHYLSIIALRLSFCWLFLRIALLGWQKYFIYVIAITTTIINLFNLFRLNIFFCNPVPAFWNYSFYPNAKCLSAHTTIILFYLQYSVAVAADFATSILPLFLLKGSTMDMKTRFLTCCLLGMGIFASGAAITVIVKASTFADAGDYTSSALSITTAIFAEPFIGIIAASFATLRPLFKRLNRTMKGAFCSSGGSGSDQRLAGLEVDGGKTVLQPFHHSELQRGPSEIAHMAEIEGLAPIRITDAKT